MSPTGLKNQTVESYNTATGLSKHKNEEYDTRYC